MAKKKRSTRRRELVKADRAKRRAKEAPAGLEPPVVPIKTLTAKESRFVEEFLVDLNATKAAIRAGYSKKAARQIGTENLSKPAIRDAIAEARAKLAEALEVTKEGIAKELSLLGFSNLADFTRADEDGGIHHDFSNVTRAQMAAVSELTVEEFMDGGGEDARPVRRTKLKLSDKKGALVALAELLYGSPKQRIEHSGELKVSSKSETERLVRSMTEEEIAAALAGQEILRAARARLEAGATKG